VQPIPPREPIDHNLLLDSLTYSTAGTWAAFRALAEQVSDEPWAAAEIARTLSSLGHIDLQLAPRGLRPERWAVAPTTLALLASGDAIVCGARSERLKTALSKACADVGIALSIEPQPNAPDRWSMPAGSEVALDLASALGREGLHVEIAQDPGLGYAKALPNITQVAILLETTSTPLGVPAKRFDPATSDWVDHSGLISPGAYRYLSQPVAYGVVAPGMRAGRVYSVDNRWAKWVAAALLGWELLGYDSESRTLTCPLGAQLPGMYERAVVLSSGWAPQPMTSGTVNYRDVSPEIVAYLWSAMAPSPAEAGT
jgi:hypothetical protein